MDPTILGILIMVVFFMYLLFGYWNFWAALLVNVPFLLFFGLRTFALLRKNVKDVNIRYFTAAVLAALFALYLRPSLAMTRIWLLTVLVTVAYAFYFTSIYLERFIEKNKRR